MGVGADLVTLPGWGEFAQVGLLLTSMEELSHQPTPDFRSAHYDPPSVPWWALLSIFIFLGSIAQFLPHARIWTIVTNLLGALWCVYICLWLRRLDADSRALYWILAGTGAQLIDGVVTLTVDPEVSWWPTLFSVAYGLSFLVGIYVIRAELERHYNQREQFSLSLGLVMTFFFSFIYFQYHLYDIAEIRKRDREALIAPV